MKDYVDKVMADLKSGGNKDFIPEIPKAPTDGKTIYLDVPPEGAVPEDLDNQDLSCNPEERIEQLDYQAQKSEELQTLG